MLVTTIRNPMSNSSSLRIFCIAGEASGDVLGASIIQALKKQYDGSLEMSGIGGPLMHKQGLESIFPMEDLSVMGIVEVLSNLRCILKRINQTVDSIVEYNPDIILTIDSPDFCFRVIERLKKKGENNAKAVHCVAPSVWAWRPGRAKKVAKFLDMLLCLLPFEPPYFTKENLPAEFIGHPAIENKSDNQQRQRERFRSDRHIPPDAKTIGLLCGSRRSEVERHTALLAHSLKRLQEEKGKFHIIIPSFPKFQPMIKRLLLEHMGHAFFDHIHFSLGQENKWDAFSAMDMALAVSGTVGLELAIAGVPHAIVYKMNPVTWSLIKGRIQVRYAHLVNIMLDKPVIPEFIQGNATPEAIHSVLMDLWDNPEQQKEALDEASQQIVNSNMLPSECAATALLSVAR